MWLRLSIIIEMGSLGFFILKALVYLKLFSITIEKIFFVVCGITETLIINKLFK